MIEIINKVIFLMVDEQERLNMENRGVYGRALVSKTSNGGSTPSTPAYCEDHKCWVNSKISRKTGKEYWLCLAGEENHFLRDPNYEPYEGYGQDDGYMNRDE